jgi:tetratricopeptide (TPR) repeat protein
MKQTTDIIDLLGEQFNLGGSLDEKLEEVDRFVDKQNNNPRNSLDTQLLWQSAKFQLKHGNPYKALPALRAATKIATGDPAAYFNLGVAFYNIAKDDAHVEHGYERKELLQKAQEAFNLAYSLNRDNQKYREAFLRLSNMAKHYSGPLAIERQLALESLNPVELTCLGIAHLYSKEPGKRTEQDYTNALFYFTKAREKDVALSRDEGRDDNPVYLVNLAEVNAAFAVEVVETTLPLLSIVRNRHKMLTEEGKHDEAEKAYDGIKASIEEAIRQRSYDSLLDNEDFIMTLNYFGIKPNVIKQEPYFKLLDDFDIDEALRQLEG